MASVIDDTDGQWIALSGLATSLSLVLVAVLINQAAVTDYYSSYAALEFPKETIREITAQTQESAKSLAQLAWELNHTGNETVLSNFTVLLSSYNAQVSMIYAIHGETVDITLSKAVFNSNHNIDLIWLNISYNDGITRYASEPEIIEMKQ
ncbi:MAG: hypothetical protein O8C66_02970 [Candidatus Methanoperedens sp.]|nr:hypothetical protein [Candidatus Methanoperedens sp.]MCZ7369449.1 hypothetical protein [Candidatus Methanoperedens sp.]